MKKYLLLIVAVAFTSFKASAQLIDNLTIGVESNAIWYNDDKATDKFFDEENNDGDEHFRSNSYLKIDYRFLNNFTATVQAESYEPLALLNYSPNFNDTNLGTYSLNYRNEKLDVTAGHYYVQFGSGLILRAWEDRQLGLNNALLGGKATYAPTDYFSVTGLYGSQRFGFKTSDSDIYGLNTEFDLSNLLKMDNGNITVGLSYVGRKEDIFVKPIIPNPGEPAVTPAPNYDELTNAFSGRIDYTGNSFYFGAEYVTKDEDAIRLLDGTISNDFVKKGSALLLNTGFSKKGLGIDVTFRRMENMSFYSERAAAKNEFNENVLNYVPALTKQHDYLLTNIYVYQAQPHVSFQDFSLLKAGEIGGQIDIFYNAKKGSVLGGKYGTKFAINGSYWANLKGDYTYQPPSVYDYDTDFFGFGQKYFSDISLEIRKKWSKDWSSIFYYVNQYYSQRYIEERTGVVKSNIAVAETTYKMGGGRSVRVEAQHLWADEDLKNWAGGTLEFNLNPRFSFYVNDIYNYGNDNVDDQIHYYNVGGSYSKGATRVALNYGRQRGGLLCVGGVCRFVAESTGLTINLTTSF